jgi:hypothetical protein
MLNLGFVIWFMKVQEEVCIVVICVPLMWLLGFAAAHPGPLYNIYLIPTTSSQPANCKVGLWSALGRQRVGDTMLPESSSLVLYWAPQAVERCRALAGREACSNALIAAAHGIGGVHRCVFLVKRMYPAVLSMEPTV